MTVGILNPKGGTGKTTIAVNLARALQADNRAVLLLDTDPQGTAQDWQAAQAQERDMPAVVGVTEANALKRELTRLSSAYDDVIIDGSAKVQGITGATVSVSDIVLIPVRPSPTDLWGVADLVDVIRTRQEAAGTPKAAFVVSQQIVRTNLADVVQEALEGYELPVFEARTAQRVVYAESMIDGSTVLDDAPNSKAATEIRAIKEELLNFTQK